MTFSKSTCKISIQSYLKKTLQHIPLIQLTRRFFFRASFSPTSSPTTNANTPRFIHQLPALCPHLHIHPQRISCFFNPSEVVQSMTDAVRNCELCKLCANTKFTNGSTGIGCCKNTGINSFHWCLLSDLKEYFYFEGRRPFGSVGSVTFEPNNPL